MYPTQLQKLPKPFLPPAPRRHLRGAGGVRAAAPARTARTARPPLVAPLQRTAAGGTGGATPSTGAKRVLQRLWRAADGLARALGMSTSFASGKVPIAEGGVSGFARDVWALAFGGAGGPERPSPVTCHLCAAACRATLRRRRVKLDRAAARKALETFVRALNAALVHFERRSLAQWLHSQTAYWIGYAWQDLLMKRLPVVGALYPAPSDRSRAQAGHAKLTLGMRVLNAGRAPARVMVLALVLEHVAKTYLKRFTGLDLKADPATVERIMFGRKFEDQVRAFLGGNPDDLESADLSGVLAALLTHAAFASGLAKGPAVSAPQLACAACDRHRQRCGLQKPADVRRAPAVTVKKVKVRRRAPAPQGPWGAAAVTTGRRDIKSYPLNDDDLFDPPPPPRLTQRFRRLGVRAGRAAKKQKKPRARTAS